MHRDCASFKYSLERGARSEAGMLESQLSSFCREKDAGSRFRRLRAIAEREDRVYYSRGSIVAFKMPKRYFFPPLLRVPISEPIRTEGFDRFSETSGACRKDFPVCEFGHVTGPRQYGCVRRETLSVLLEKD